MTNEPSTKLPKILLVDDDAFLTSLYKKKGEEQGIDLRTAQGGTEAIALMTEGFIPDVVALDMSMVGMSGIDIFKEMKAKQLAPNAKVVFLSNTSDDETVAEANALGAAKFIVKASMLPSEVVEALVGMGKEKE